MSCTALVFVYRTDANPFSLGAEFFREVKGGDAYECSLCHLTYGTVMKKSVWTRFTKSLPVSCRFHLRSRFVRQHPELADVEYPCVFVEDDASALHEFLDADELRQCTTIEELIDAVRVRLDALLTQPARP